MHAHHGTMVWTFRCSMCVPTTHLKFNLSSGCPTLPLADSCGHNLILVPLSQQVLKKPSSRLSKNMMTRASRKCAFKFKNFPLPYPGPGHAAAPVHFPQQCRPAKKQPTRKSGAAHSLCKQHNQLKHHVLPNEHLLLPLPLLLVVVLALPQRSHRRLGQQRCSCQPPQRCQHPSPKKSSSSSHQILRDYRNHRDLRPMANVQR